MYDLGAASTKKSAFSPLIASCNNSYRFFTIYFSSSSIFSNSTDFPATYPTFKHRKPVRFKNSLTCVGLRFTPVNFSIALLASAILEAGFLSK